MYGGGNMSFNSTEETKMKFSKSLHPWYRIQEYDIGEKRKKTAPKELFKIGTVV